jgi:hypothetical protein
MIKFDERERIWKETIVQNDYLSWRQWICDTYSLLISRSHDVVKLPIMSNLVVKRLLKHPFEKPRKWCEGNIKIDNRDLGVRIKGE